MGIKERKGVRVKMSKSEATRLMKKNEEASPLFVQTEKLIERMKELTQSIGHRAFEFFDNRGRQFGRDLEDWLHAESEVLRPVPVEIAETDDQLLINAEVPGFKADEIEVSVEPNSLIISGKTEKKTKEEKGKTVYSEWQASEFCRALDLPASVNPAKAEAILKNGILTLTLPKTDAKEGKNIKVKVA